MKSIFYATLVTAVLAAPQSAVCQVQGELELRLQRAIQIETVDGNLHSAIEQYKTIVAQAGRNRQVAAKALVRMAGCYQKLGDAESRKIYERILREYGDQQEQVEVARQRLSAMMATHAEQNDSATSARRVPIPATAGLVVSDGRHVFYVDRVAGGLVKSAMDGSNPIVIYRLPANRQSGLAGWPVISPDGQHIAFNLSSADHASICIVGADGSGFRELYRKSVRGIQPVGGWSPDGGSLMAHLLEPDGSYSVATISVKDGSVRKIDNDRNIRGTYALATPGNGDFTPDGKFVFYPVRPSNGQESNIRIAAVDGSYHGNLIEHPSTNLPVGFAPDGKHFLFQSDRSGMAGIYAVVVSDGKTQGEPVLIKQEPALSPNATSFTRNGTFFYTVGEQAVHEAFTVNLDPVSGKTVGSPQLLSGPAGLIPESAAWSPDDKKLAFISGRNHLHGGGDVMLTVRTLDTKADAEWKMPPETEAVVGWAADGSAVYTAVRYASADRMELHSVSPLTGESKTLVVIPSAKVIYCVRAAPENGGLLISYGAQPPTPGRPAGVIRLDTHTGHTTDIIPKGVVSEATLSPDGKQVAALDREASTAAVKVKPLDGGEWRNLASLEGHGYMYLQWLPNGDLLFGKESIPTSELFRLPVGRSAPEKIGDLAPLQHAHEIRVRPDGQKLVVQSYVSHVEFWALENFLPKEYLRP
jgi:Tol biopolymer transport system component